MNNFVNWLAPHLPLAVMTMTLLLLLGCAAAALTRSPAHRQRIGELTIAGVLLWLVLAILPLPRLHSTNSAPLVDGPARGGASPANDAANVELQRDSVGWVRLEGTGVPPGTELNSEPSVVKSQLNADVVPEAEFANVSESGTTSVVGSKGQKPEKQTHNALAPYSPGALIEPKAPAGEVLARIPLRIAAWIFLSGVATAMAWLVLGHVLLIRERLTAAAPPTWLFRLFQRVAEPLTERLPRLVVSQRSGRPLTWGILRPTIALPERICYRANHEQLRTVLLHELAHVRRGDARGNLLFELALPLLAFHPLYWWLRRQVRMSAELLADDWASRQAGREVYVTQLVALARGTNLRRLSLAFGTGVLTNPSQFYRRMKMLLTRDIPLTTRLSIFWRLSAVGSAIVAVCLATAFVGNPAASADEPTTPTAVEKAPGGPDLPPTNAKDVPNQEVAPVAVGRAAVATAEESKPGISQNAATDTVSQPEKPSVSEPQSPPAPPKPVETTAEVPGVSDLPVVGRLFVNKPSDDPRATTEQLQNERDELRKEVQVLKARLEALERGSKRIWLGTGADEKPVKVIQLTRPEINGKLVVETWTVDPKGKPDRIVSKAEVAGDSPITVATPGKVEGSIVVKEFQDKNGNRWVHSYQLAQDGKVGKLVESRIEGSGDEAAASVKTELAQPPAVPTALPKPEKVPYPDRPAPAAAAPRGGAAYPPLQYGAMDSNGPVVSTRPLDLVALATSYADAVSAVEIAKANLAEAEQQNAEKAQGRQLMSLRAGLEGAMRKERLLRRVAEVAATGAKQQYERAVRAHSAGAIAAEEMEEIRARLEILKHILSANDSESKPAAP